MSEQHNIENSDSVMSEAATTAAAKTLALQERQRTNKRNQRERNVKRWYTICWACPHLLSDSRQRIS